MSYSIRETANALAKAINRENSDDLFNRLKSLVQYRILEANKRLGAGRTSARTFSEEEACIAALFCILADHNFDQWALESLRVGLQSRASGVKQTHIDGELTSIPYWDNPEDEERHIANVIPRIEAGETWYYVINFMQDRNGFRTYSSHLSKYRTGSLTTEQRAAVAEHYKFHGQTQVGTFCVNFSEIISKFLKNLMNEE